MKVAFDFSAADLAEVASRATNRSPLVQQWRMRGYGMLGTLVGLLAFLAIPGDLVYRSVAAGLIATPFFIAMGRQPQQRPQRLVKYFREPLGGNGPFKCEVELTQAGIIARQLGAESRHSWAQVVSITEIPGGIEFVYRPLGSLVVRDRAFATAQQRAEFLKVARGYLAGGST